ncbi:fibronectin type III domain-containing protein [Peribacillus frigoritolerans]|uniref:fibronectin type III domain-containing protein n=1 Tax=Peribacillus frigoritolerans TaxID=450367 RepID=UPI0010598B42|nr:fibronectin type III domain-containing protein [Peribacillus frigoritolerans]TDL78966.1 LPXTG cell wall anchor domain-containing protein [Peribacillus frigoritolerans]
MKRMLSIFMIFSLLVTMALPYTAAAEAGTTLIGFHSFKNTGKGIQLLWTTTSMSEEPETFVLKKNEQDHAIEAKLVDELKNRDGSTARTYEFIDEDVKEKETYTYLVKLAGNDTVQTDAITVVYKKGNDDSGTPVDPGEPVVIDDKFKLNARVEGTSIIVSWPKYNVTEAVEYQLFQDGKFVQSFSEEGEYASKDLTPGTTYAFTMKVIAGDKLLDTKETSAKTEEAQKPNYTVFFYQVNDSSFEASWFLDGAVSYDVYLDGKLMLEKTAETENIFTDLNPATEYEVKAAAFDKDGKMISEAAVKGKTKEAAKGKTIEFKDKNLKFAVQEQLRIQRDITESDLEKLTYLNASAYVIKDLSGLEYAVNLQHLELAGNRLKNLEALKAFEKLEYLDLTMSGATDFSPLNSLTNLHSLLLGDTSFKDLKHIGNLTGLKLLDISWTSVKDLSVLASFKQLEEINLSYTEVKSIKVLADLPSLQKVIIYGSAYIDILDETGLFKESVEFVYDDSLNMYMNQVKPGDTNAVLEWDYEGEGRLAYYEVTIGGKKEKIETSKNSFRYEASDLKPDTQYSFSVKAFSKEGKLLGFTDGLFSTLKTPSGEKVIFADANLKKAMKEYFGFKRDIVESDMEHLTELDLTGAGIRELSGLETAKNLKFLGLSMNNIKDLKPIENLTGLTGLLLDGNPLQDFSSLKKWPNLQYLDLSDTGIKDLSVLSPLKELGALGLAYNSLEDLSGMPALEQLASLYLGGNELSSLKGIERLTGLTELSVSENLSLKGIEELTGLKNLYFLDLSTTSIESIDPLLALDSLEYVLLFDIDTLDLSDGSAAFDVITQLRDKGVYVEYEYGDGEAFHVYSTRATEDSIEISWDYFGEEEIDHYKVAVDGKTAADKIDGYEYGYWVRGLAPETSYDIEVQAYNSDGELIASAETTETTAAAPTGPVVKFKDSTLREIIKEQLGLNRDVRASDMERLEDLFLADMDIKDLSGLEYATNLMYVYLLNNESELDLSPLRGLPIFDLTIENTKLKGYEKIAEMESLVSLSIRNNQLKDISFIKEMEQLDYLDLSQNEIRDIAVLSNLDELEVLVLFDNQIEHLGDEGLEDLMSLEISRNPLKDLSGLDQFHSLEVLTLERTELTAIDELLNLEDLSLVSLYGISTLDLSSGSDADLVVQELRDRGVTVQIDITHYPEIHIEDVTQHSISFSWDKMFEGTEGSYFVIVDGEFTGEEEPLPASQTSYELTDLEPDTTYLIEVYGESDEFGNAASIEVTTLPEDEEGMKQAEFYLINEDEQPISEAEFLIEGLDKNNEDILFEGYSNELGQLIDDLQADEGKFSLKVGAYSLFVYNEGIEYEYEFTIEEEQDYLKNPLVFVLGSEKPETGETPDPGKETPVKEEQPEKEITNEPILPEKAKPASGIRENELPKTATVMYQSVFFGAILMMAGAALYAARRKKA